MSREKRSGYIDVDELMPQVTLEQAAAYYGVSLPELHRARDEIRTRCFLNCGRNGETGGRALGIKSDDPVKRWRCHQYGCGLGGNLVSLCDLLKSGANAGGRPRGERFKEIAADLKAIVDGTPPPAPSAPAQRAIEHTQRPTAAEAPKANVPLARSGNERARALVTLDEKLVTDPGGMSPAAAARRRPFLSFEACRKWRMGYLPSNAGSDRSGGTMRRRV